LKYHSDKNPQQQEQADEAFKELQNIYDTLWKKHINYTDDGKMIIDESFLDAFDAFVSDFDREMDRYYRQYEDLLRKQYDLLRKNLKVNEECVAILRVHLNKQNECLKIGEQYMQEASEYMQESKKYLRKADLVQSEWAEFCKKSEEDISYLRRQVDALSGKSLATPSPRNNGRIDFWTRFRGEKMRPHYTHKALPTNMGLSSGQSDC
jgi:hypothetical protein